LTQPFQTCQTNKAMESDTPKADLHDDIVVEQPLEQQKKPSANLYKKFLIPAGFILVLFICIPVILLVLSRGKTQKTQNTAPTPAPSKQIKISAKPTPASTQSPLLLYGTWTSQSSVIRAIDTTTSKSLTVATLPLTIKKVTMLSSNLLLYIDQTDSNDHGGRISIYDRQQKQITTSIPAANGFGIDDYVLSPNKRYLVLWEVQFAPQSNTLQGGKSQVYSVDLTSPTVTNLLYDETATPTIPIHYPLAVLNDGTVFVDQMIPNDPNGGAGWAYGMSMVDFDGTNKKDIASMSNGTYGSQPTLSSDGKFLLFAGYDGSNGDGTAVKNGYRQALLTPNTVELLDTQTLKRYQLPNLPDTNAYSSVQWDQQTDNIILATLSSDAKQMGVYAYDPGKLTMKQISLPVVSGIPYGYISQLSNNKTLIGTQSTDAANLGNLGDTYSYAYTQVATLDKDATISPLAITDPFIQTITVLPGNYFYNVLGAETAQVSPQPSVTYAVLQGTNDSNPAHYSFFLKTTLATRRLQGKSSPIGPTNTLSCLNLENARCSALGIKVNSKAYTECENIQKTNNSPTNACY